MCVAMNVFFWAECCILVTIFFGNKWKFSKCKFEKKKHFLGENCQNFKTTKLKEKKDLGCLACELN
jgi:hypothetical protein